MESEPEKGRRKPALLNLSANLFFSVFKVDVGMIGGDME